MTTIFALVKNALDTISPSVAHHVEPFIGPLPDTYLVYLMPDSSPKQHFDNVEVGRSYLVQVTIRCRDGLASLPDVDTAMTAAGFTKGRERQLPKDPKSGHYALAKDYEILITQ